MTHTKGAQAAGCCEYALCPSLLASLPGVPSHTPSTLLREVCYPLHPIGRPVLLSSQHRPDVATLSITFSPTTAADWKTQK